MKKHCIVHGCDKPQHRYGYCRKHWKRKTQDIDGIL